MRLIRPWLFNFSLKVKKVDIFYYWKNVNEDIKANRIGWFRSSHEKLADLSDGSPDYLWVFKTPKGLKGQVQLIARLKWEDSPVAPMTRTPGESYVFYNPFHSDSVLYSDSGSAACVGTATDWVQRNFPAAIRGNFQGGNGQQALRGSLLRELNYLTNTWPTEPFRFAP